MEDLLTVGWFFDFHEIKESPMKIQNPVTNRLVSGQVAQSKSLKALSCNGELDGKNSPNVGEDLTYQRTHIAAS